MKKTLLTIAAVVSCAVIMASCGGNTANSVTDTTNTTAAITSAASVTTVATTEPTTAQLTSAATSNLEKKSEAASTAKTTAAKTAAKKAAATTKKSAPKTTAKKATATTKKGLTEADVLWAQKKANEYIASLPKAFVQEDAEGYFGRCGVPNNIKTKEQLLAHFKEDIKCDYDIIINAEGSLSKIGMFLDIIKTNSGYAYNILNEPWL